MLYKITCITVEYHSVFCSIFDMCKYCKLSYGIFALFCGLYAFVRLLACQLCSSLCYSRDHFVYVPSHWETTLHCNVVSHWLGAYIKLSPLLYIIATCMSHSWISIIMYRALTHLVLRPVFRANKGNTRAIEAFDPYVPDHQQPWYWL